MSEDTVQRLMGLHDIAADLHADTLKDHNTGGEVVAAAAARSTLESALREALSAFPVELEQPEQPLGVSPQAGPRSPSQAPTIADAAQRALKVSEFPAVKEARRAASAQLQFYRDMMAAAALREGSNPKGECPPGPRVKPEEPGHEVTRPTNSRGE